MRYAKLINSFPIYAPNPITHNGLRYGNPPDEIYTAEGYKPVHFTEPPDQHDEGYIWAPKWVETETDIMQGWELVEKTEYDGDEAMGFIFGGEN